MFEAVHGSAPDIAGLGVANPSSLTLSAAMLLDHVGQPEVATRIRSALTSVLADPELRTRDVGGSQGTRGFTDAVIRQLA
jgi:isocitrate/isopropylmalate dehydrogenase